MRLAVCFLLLALGGLHAQVIPGRFVLELDDQPATVSARTSSQARLRQVMQTRGIRVVGQTKHILNALVVDGADEATLAATPGVRKVYPVVTIRATLDRALDLHRVPEAWNLLNGASNQGAGMKIGLLDTGIDPTHPGFSDDGMKAPEGFPKLSSAAEAVNANGKIIVARLYASRTPSARDVFGHGTGTAMIAAGRTNTGPRGAITGVAPKAWLGNYKVLNDSGSGSSDSILQAIDDAVADGMDVISMSLGAFPSVRPGDDIQVRAVERAIAAGVIVVTAAGNEGPDPSTISSPAQATNAIAVGNASNDRIFQTFVRFGGNAELSGLPSNSDKLPASLQAALVDAFDVDSHGELCQRPQTGALRGRVALILRGSCTFEEKLASAAAAGAVAAIIYSKPEDPDAVSMDVGQATLPAMSVSSADGLTLRDQLRSDPDAEVTLAFVNTAVRVNSNQISWSSSRGPDTNANVKPELLAVGSSVYTAAPTVRGIPSWQVASGTSLATPFVSGAAALLKAARPGLSVAQYRSLIINSSRELSAAVDAPFAVQSAGAGRMDVSAAMLATVTAVPSTVSFGVGASSTVTRERAIRLTNVGTAADTWSLSAVPYSTGAAPILSENTMTLAPGASRDVTLRFTASDPTPGQYSGVLIVRGTNSDAEARIPWWFGVPSERAAYLTLVDPQDTVRPSATAVLYVRPTDAAGFSIGQRPEVSAVSGGGRVTAVQEHLLYPGFYTISLRMGSLAGANVFDITAAGLTRRYVITTE